jgi:hypothetical protein
MRPTITKEQERSPFLRNPEFPRYNAQSAQVREMLGLPPKAKLPREGMDPRLVQGILVWVEPIRPQCYGGRKVHRVLARCPECGKVLSAGRLHQHVCHAEG